MFWIITFLVFLYNHDINYCITQLRQFMPYSSTKSLIKSELSTILVETRADTTNFVPSCDLALIIGAQHESLSTAFYSKYTINFLLGTRKYTEFKPIRLTLFVQVAFSIRYSVQLIMTPQFVIYTPCRAPRISPAINANEHRVTRIIISFFLCFFRKRLIEQAAFMAELFTFWLFFFTEANMV